MIARMIINILYYIVTQALNIIEKYGLVISSYSQSLKPKPALFVQTIFIKNTFSYY